MYVHTLAESGQGHAVSTSHRYDSCIIAQIWGSAEYLPGHSRDVLPHNIVSVLLVFVYARLTTRFHLQVSTTVMTASLLFLPAYLPPDVLWFALNSMSTI